VLLAWMTGKKVKHYKLSSGARNWKYVMKSVLSSH